MLNYHKPVNQKAAADLARAIKTFAEQPEALDNFQSYLSYHFTTWMEKWANDPAGLASEFLFFANME